MTITFTADCPCHGRPATFTASHDGVASRITDIQHEEAGT